MTFFFRLIQKTKNKNLRLHVFSIFVLEMKLVFRKNNSFLRKLIILLNIIFSNPLLVVFNSDFALNNVFFL